ncbi:hypothetical protein MKW92_022730 [Papaver armeniacum]|nr:hypothetical protein MKW92_022730 [Papaver armeniacum]
MSLSTNNKYNEGLGKNPNSKAVEEGAQNDSDDDRPCKILGTSGSNINLLGKCLKFIFKCLQTSDDCNSFGLTCRQWLHIQNNNRKSLWYYNNLGSLNDPRISPENFPIVLRKLLTRFQHLKYLSLRGCPKITDFVTFKSEFFVSKVQYLCLDDCFQYSDIELSVIFSWFPSLTHVSLMHSYITDKGLEALAKCCSFLETVNLSGSHSFTDSGINFLIKNCPKLGKLNIRYCSKISGIGFLGCPQTLTNLEAKGCKFSPEGISAIVSGSGLECLIGGYLSTINTEAVMIISKSCPLLEKMELSNCEDIELQGWEAIGRNCKNLEHLYVYKCSKLCDLGLQALCNGCDKLSKFFVDYENNCSSAALEIFKRKKPDVMFRSVYHRYGDWW